MANSLEQSSAYWRCLVFALVRHSFCGGGSRAQRRGKHGGDIARANARTQFHYPRVVVVIVVVVYIPSIELYTEANNWQRSFFVPVFSLHLPWGRRIICREEVSCVLGGRHCAWKGSTPYHWKMIQCTVAFWGSTIGQKIFTQNPRFIVVKVEK